MAKKSFSKKPKVQSRTADAIFDHFDQNAFDQKARVKQALEIHPELKPYIPPLRPEEFDTLEESILSEGRVRESLLVWKSPEGNFYLLDGHHRYQVIQAHQERDLTWDIEVKENLASLDDAKRFMRQLQLGRRNLTTHQMAYLRGRTYHDLKKEASRPEGQQQASGKTKDLLAAEFKVGPATILRDAVFCAGVDRFAADDLRQDLQEERDRILLHESIFLKGEIELLGKYPELDLELAFEFKKSGGGLKEIINLPAEEREEAMQAFLKPEEVKAPVQKSNSATQTPADRFEKWWNQQNKHIGKVIGSKDNEAIALKKRELEEQAERIQLLLEKLREIE